MRALKTITAGELIGELETIPKNARVAFISDYGDHCHTMQVHGLEGDIERRPIFESSYSDSGYAVGDSESDDKEAKETIYIIS